MTALDYLAQYRDCLRAARRARRNHARFGGTWQQTAHDWHTHAAYWASCLAGECAMIANTCPPHATSTRYRASARYYAKQAKRLGA